MNKATRAWFGWLFLWGVVLVLGLSIASTAVHAQASLVDPKLQNLIILHQKGQTLFDMASLRHEGSLADIERKKKAGYYNGKAGGYAAAIKRQDDIFKRTSLNLTKRYRLPIVKHMKELVPGLNRTLGTEFYVDDGHGGTKINPKHRGWNGDFDFQGSQGSLNKIEKIMNANGAKISVSARADGSTLSSGVTQKTITGLEITVNSQTIANGAESSLKGATDNRIKIETEVDDIKNRLIGTSGAEKSELTKKLADKQVELSGAKRQEDIRKAYKTQVTKPGFTDSFLTPGSTAHSDLQKIRANDIETFSSASMGKNQVFRQSVEVEDHFKKAAKGLGTSSTDLVQNNDSARSKFQSMMKSTQKAIGAAQLTTPTLEKILKNNGYPGSVADYKAELERYKSGEFIGRKGSAADVARFQNITKDVFTEGRTAGNRHDKARLKWLEGKLLTATPEERIKIKNDIIDGRTRLDASIDANNSRVRLGKIGMPPPPDVPRLAGVPGNSSNIMKYGGRGLGLLSIVMAPQLFKQNFEDLHDDSGGLISITEMTGRTLADLADLGGVSVKQFVKNFSSDLKATDENLDKYGVKNGFLRGPAKLLTAVVSPLKSVAVGGVDFFLGNPKRFFIDMPNVGLGALFAKWESEQRVGNLDNRLIKEKRFNEGHFVSDKRQQLGALTIDREIFLLNSGLGAKDRDSPFLTQIFLRDLVANDTSDNKVWLKRLESKVGKLSDAEKLDFIKRRAEFKKDYDADIDVRWKKAGEAQDSLRARLLGLEAKLGAENLSPEDYENLRGQMKSLQQDMSRFRGLVDDMHAGDLETISSRTGVDGEGGSTIRVGDRFAFRSHTNWGREDDKMARHLDRWFSPGGFDLLIFDARDKEKRALEDQRDLLAELGYPDSTLAEVIADLQSKGIDLASALGEIVLGGVPESLTDVLDELAEASDDSDAKLKSLVATLERPEVKVPTRTPVTKIPVTEPKPTTTTPVTPPTAPTNYDVLDGDFSGSFGGTQYVEGQAAARVRGGVLKFAILGSRVTGEISGQLYFADDHDVFRGTVIGTYDPATGTIKATMNGTFTNDTDSGEINGWITGKQTDGGFTGKWSGIFLGGTWQAHATRVKIVHWPEYMCEHYREAWIEAGETCK